MIRVARIVLLGALLAALTGFPATAQDDTEGGPLAALCEENAPDGTTLASCLKLVATVLATARVPTPWEVFESAAQDLLAEYSASRLLWTTGTCGSYSVSREGLACIDLSASVWLPRDPETGRTLDPKKKKQARRAREVAGMAATDLRGFLLSVTPDDCYEGLYAALWGLSSAWGHYEDGLLRTKSDLRPVLVPLLREGMRTTCGEPDEPRWRIDIGQPDTGT
jgi:hypothetical protein